jgi:tetratricopeptide (TPR) repeat protein
MDEERPLSVEDAQDNYDLIVALHGEDAPEAQIALRQLARAHRDMGANRHAETLLRKSLAIQKRSEASDPVLVIRTEFDLANVLLRLREFGAARPLWEHIVTAADRLKEQDDELLLRASINLAITLRELKRFGDEFPLRVRILADTRKSVGNEHPETLRCLVDLATVQENLGNHELALDAYQEALSGFQRIDADPRTILQQQWAIASVLVSLNRPNEASEMFDRVLQGCIQHLDPKDPLRRRAQKQSRVYSLLGRLGGRKRRGTLEV